MKNEAHNRIMTHDAASTLSLANDAIDVSHATTLELIQLLGLEPENIHPDDRLCDILYPAVCALVQDNRSLQHQQILLQRDINKLVRYLEQLQHDIIMVEESRAWRIGFKIMRVVKAALGRPVGRHAFTNIHRVLTIYHHWKKARD